MKGPGPLIISFRGRKFQILVTLGVFGKECLYFMYPQFEGQNNYLNSSINMSYFIKFNWITQCLIDYRTLLASFIVIIIYHFLLLNSHVRPLPHPRGEGVLPYITYTGMCRPTGSWFWSSWFRTGYPFQRRFLEWGIKYCGSWLYLLLKIVADYEEAFISCISWTNKEMSFKKTGLFQSTNFLERSIKNWPISRTGCQF